MIIKNLGKIPMKQLKRAWKVASQVKMFSVRSSSKWTSRLFLDYLRLYSINCIILLYFFRRAVDEVVQDLTRILTKDIKKRMCETVAFYHLDKWWMEQETKYKEKVKFAISKYKIQAILKGN